MVTNSINFFEFLKQIPRRGWWFCTDFEQTLSTTGNDKSFRVFASGTGTGVTPLTTTNNNRVGIAQFSTGTTATGRSAILLYNSPIRLGAGLFFYEADLRVVTLSTSTERFAFLSGLGDVETAVNQTDGIYFLYDEGGVSTGSTASANFQCVTVSNSTRTFTNSGIAVVANQYYKLRIDVNVLGTSVSFYIDDVLVATHTTNIPAAGGRETSLLTLLMKSAGTTARLAQVDYINAIYEFSLPRDITIV